MKKSEKYQKYALCREMQETVELVKNFSREDLTAYARAIRDSEAVMLTGEGSSRIFPAKNSISREMEGGMKKALYTEGATQALEYNLEGFSVFGASNSGKTKELIRLFHKLKNEGHSSLYGLTANRETPLEELCQSVKVLSCGNEDAVAATKSVVEQALFYEASLRAASGRSALPCREGGDGIEEALSLDIPEDIISRIAGADTIYFAGRNNGVAEELTLKTNEITRKKSDFLEGTYAAHGIEEVMKADDVVIVIDPFEEEEEKYYECLYKGVGTALISLSTRKTKFPYNVILPDNRDFKNYIQLTAGWNLLVETGLFLGINLDKPMRARKVGNEFIP